MHVRKKHTLHGLAGSQLLSSMIGFPIVLDCVQSSAKSCLVPSFVNLAYYTRKSVEKRHKLTRKGAKEI